MSVGKFYLILYNSLQFLGWSALLLQIILHFQRGGTTANLYASVDLTLQIFQTGAVLEILHAAAGLVRSSVQVTFQQVFSRVYITWAILYLLPPARLSVGVLMLLFAWTITEMIRYSLYAIQLVSTPPYFLTWLRYSFFIIAYPVGVTGELLCSYAGLLTAYETGVFSVTFPNVMNATFSFPLVIAVIMLLYVPLFPPMYLHMFSQRKKVLGASAKQE
jgi:very-long-chain (3R)-3-hydroxyacyl-CoA dehydratase